MMSALPALTELLRKIIPNGLCPSEVLQIFFLILTRWLVITLTAPFLGAQILPSLNRLALATSLSILTLFLVINNPSLTIDSDVAYLALLFIKEALLGFVIGFSMGLIFYCYQQLGEFIDFARAASMSRLLVPELKLSSSAMGTLFFQLSLVLFFGLGLHRDLIKNISAGFLTFPVQSLDLGHDLDKDLLYLATHIMGKLFALALRLSLPVLFTCFLIDLAFGLMNRVAPQINAYFLSLPIKMIGGLLLILLALSFITDDFLKHYQEMTSLLFAP